MSGGKKRESGIVEIAVPVEDFPAGAGSGETGWRVQPTTQPGMQAKQAAAVQRIREGNRRWAGSQADKPAREPAPSQWQRETHVLTKPEAQKKAKAFFRNYPKTDYLAEIESWRVLEDERVEFTLRYFPRQI